MHEVGWTVFLVSCDVGEWSHNVTRRADFKIVFDHILIVLSNGRMFTGPRPFQFFNTWCSDAELQRLVSDSWDELDSASSFFWFMFSGLWAKVRNWQHAKYSASVIRSKVCEMELSSLLTSSVPQNSDELESFTLQKREFSL